MTWQELSDLSFAFHCAQLALQAAIKQIAAQGDVSHEDAALAIAEGMRRAIARQTLNG